MGTIDFYKEINKERGPLDSGAKESDRQFAKRLGISHNMLRYWSQGVGQVDPGTIRKICTTMKWPEIEYARLVHIAWDLPKVEPVKPSDISERVFRLLEKAMPEGPLDDRSEEAGMYGAFETEVYDEANSIVEQIQWEREDLETQIEELTAEVAELKKRNAELEKQIAYLEGETAQKTPRQTVKKSDEKARKRTRKQAT